MSASRDPDSDDGPPGGRDPRRIVTPYAFRVADELMGQPLATPWRRAAAMLLDLGAVLGLIVLREITGPVFFFLLAWFGYRATTERARHPVRRALPRWTLRVTAAVLLLVGVGQGIDLVSGGGPWAGDGGSEAAVEASGAGDALERVAAGEGRHIGLGEMVGMLGRVGDLRSGDTARARAAAEDMVGELRDAGMTSTEIREVLRSVSGEVRDSTMRLAFGRAVAGLDTAEAGGAPGPAADSAGRARADSLAVQWAAALETGDRAAADSARRGLTGLLAADSVSSLENRVAVLSASLRRMEGRLEEAREPPGPLAYLRGVARDLGLGLGWLGLYFTAFLALWNGHTPGKRLLGIRVAKLNGEPPGWWDSFSRFGGYAASVATGLFGFLQILWDANRQGLHDRIAGTVVLREGGGEEPPPAER